MESFASLIRYALSKEEEAAAFYGFLASSARREHIRQVFRDLSDQEEAHKKVFEKIIKECSKECVPAGVPPETDLKISDYLVDIPFDPEMNYQDAIILAMKREEKSQAFYLDLARKVTDPALGDTLRRLASEEERHKAHLENIYEKDVLTDD